MSDAIPGSDARVFPPRPNATKSGMFHFVTFAFFALLSLIVSFLPGDKPNTIPTQYIAPLGALMFGALALHGWKRLRSARISYAADDNGIWRLEDNASRVQWTQIADVQFVYPMGVDELRIDLMDASGRKLMVIRTEMLVRGGQTLVEELFRHLRPLLETKARDYLSGEKRWGIAGLKNMMRIDGEMLYTEYPAGKKQAIPLRSISRVEWIPGAVSGAKKGFVTIHHSGGHAELPQFIQGMQLFLFALKYMCGLGDRVNPQVSEDITRRVDTVRSSQFWVVVGRISGIGLIIGTLFLFGRIVLDRVDESSARNMGVPATAEITRKRESGIHVRYVDEAGKQHETPSRIKKTADATLQVGDQLRIRYNPEKQDAIWFSEKYEFGRTFWLVLSSGCLSAIILGIVLLVMSSRKQRRDKERIEQIEMPTVAAPPPLPALTPPPIPFNGTVAAPMTAGTDNSAVGSAPRTCTSCGNAIHGSYYLADGKPYCPACRATASVGLNKPSKGILLKAFAFGLLGGIVAGGLWAIATLMTGYELGIVAIFVGLTVGLSVKRGARGYSGRSLQVLALILTLFALSYAMIPIMIVTVRKNPELMEKARETWSRATGEDEDEEQEVEELRAMLTAQRGTTSTQAFASRRSMAEDDSGTSAARARVEKSDEVVEADENRPDSSTPGSQDKRSSRILFMRSDGTSVTLHTTESLAQLIAENRDDEPKESIGWSIAKLIGLLLLGFVALIFGPVVIYLMILFSSPFSALFLAIALWEAWRINRPVKRTFVGPYTDDVGINFDKADFTRG
ncbi:MAG: hypothetical protein ACR2IE_14250 [Candidatus Sumerlaeaceae bacterium]